MKKKKVIEGSTQKFWPRITPASSKWNIIEKLISKALIDSKISHDEFIIATIEEQNYLRLKENIRTKDNQQGDMESDRLIQHD